jgi:thiol oxidase
MPSYFLICSIWLVVRCRRGSADILINFDDHWPTNLSLSSQESSRLLESVAADNHLICGKEAPRGYWVCPMSEFSCNEWFYFLQ